LFYFSGHGIKDEKGYLYFATSDTRKQKGKFIPPTALSSNDVRTEMENSFCKRQIVILDCCFSGAFTKGMIRKGDETVDLSQLSGRGRAILTSSNSIEDSLAPEGSELSVYSRYLVEGLKTGAGDLDGDGKISVDELHEYAQDKVLEVSPSMTPQFYSFYSDTSRIFLALSPKEDISLKYRKEVEVIAREDNGEIQFINRQTLNQIRINLGLSNSQAKTIEDEVIEPYRLRKEKISRYREVFEKTIKNNYPLDHKTRKNLKRLQQALRLRDEDINLIEKAIVPQQTITSSPKKFPATKSSEIKSKQKLPSKSSKPKIDLLTKKGIDYTKLQYLLAKGMWQEADKETGQVMLKAAGQESIGWLNDENIAKIPSTDLRTIDRLWVSYSDGRFGFSIQKRIYNKLGKNYTKFGDYVKWRKGGKWLYWRELNFTKEAPEGHLPSGTSPLGAVNGLIWDGFRVMTTLFSRQDL
ncbi:GUN4 domain-containing protein, partial [Moorena sp. SIO4A5]|uniref:GUN4 domain-containing protein n=1 Tax=Moorena sp. SIO4A5 TaxID=2607838 RepID=UPI0025FBF2A2